MLPLGDENAVRGYQQIIDTYREAKQWPQATDGRERSDPEAAQRPWSEMVYAAQFADTGDSGRRPLLHVRALLKGNAR